MSNGRVEQMGDFQEELRKILDEYGDEVSKAMDSVLIGVGRATTNKVKAASPKRNGGYASGWNTRIERGRLSIKVIIHNTKKPGLAHLLEKGHALYKPGKNGHYIAAGRVSGRSHIKPAEEWAEKEVIRRLEAKLR